VCPICQKSIRDIYAAVAYGESQDASHFDCVLEALRAERTLEKNEKVCYLGAGTFAVVRLGGSGGFIVKERIRFEDETDRPQWRRELRRVDPT
jgi:hypothetical protein